MDMKTPTRRFHVRRSRVGSKTQVMRMSIIFVFILISTLISVLLPIYFALLPIRDIMTP